MGRRPIGALAVVVIVTGLVPGLATPSASGLSDPKERSAAKAGCLIASVAYAGGPLLLPARDTLKPLLKVKDPKLKPIVKKLLADQSNPQALTGLQQWCRRQFPNASEIANTRLIPPTTTTLPPTTTTTAPTVSVYDGSGDDVIAITKPSRINIASFQYDGPSNFIVTALNANQQRITGLVNEIGSYAGVVPLDFYDGQNTAFLQIKSSGPWHIEIRPASATPQFTMTTDGTGDAVLAYLGKAGIATVTHDGSSNFIVVMYTSTRTGLVNEIGAYQGRVPLPAGPGLMEVKADGHWSVSVG